MKLFASLLVAIPLEELNFRLLDVCSIVDGCGNANCAEVALANLSMLLQVLRPGYGLRIGLLFEKRINGRACPDRHR